MQIEIAVNKACYSAGSFIFLSRATPVAWFDPVPDQKLQRFSLLGLSKKVERKNELIETPAQTWWKKHNKVENMGHFQKTWKAQGMRSEAWQSSVCELLKAKNRRQSTQPGSRVKHHLGNEGCFFPNNLGEKGVLTSSGDLSKNFYFKTDRFNLPQGPELWKTPQTPTVPSWQSTQTCQGRRGWRQISPSSSGSFLWKLNPMDWIKLDHLPSFTAWK